MALVQHDGVDGVTSSLVEARLKALEETLRALIPHRPTAQQTDNRDDQPTVHELLDSVGHRVQEVANHLLQQLDDKVSTAEMERWFRQEMNDLIRSKVREEVAKAFANLAAEGLPNNSNRDVGHNDSMTVISEAIPFLGRGPPSLGMTPISHASRSFESNMSDEIMASTILPLVQLLGEGAPGLLKAAVRQVISSRSDGYHDNDRGQHHVASSRISMGRASLSSSPLPATRFSQRETLQTIDTRGLTSSANSDSSAPLSSLGDLSPLPLDMSSSPESRQAATESGRMSLRGGTITALNDVYDDHTSSHSTVTATEKSHRKPSGPQRRESSGYRFNSRTTVSEVYTARLTRARNSSIAGDSFSRLKVIIGGGKADLSDCHNNELPSILRAQCNECDKSSKYHDRWAGFGSSTKMRCVYSAKRMGKQGVNDETGLVACEECVQHGIICMVMSATVEDGVLENAFNKHSYGLNDWQ